MLSVVVVDLTVDGSLFLVGVAGFSVGSCSRLVSLLEGMLVLTGTFSEIFMAIFSVALLMMVL